MSRTLTARLAGGHRIDRPRPLLGAALATATALAAVPSASAQTSWDRSAEQIAIVSVPGDPAGTYRLAGAWKVEAGGVTSLPLGTLVSFSRNGLVVGTMTVGVNASVGCDNCPLPNVCLCAVPNGPCSCNALWLTTELPGPIPLSPGDVVSLNVKAVAGAAADADISNDTIVRTFDGTQSFWNRRLLSATLVPAACPAGPDLYDLELEFAYDFGGVFGALEMSSWLELALPGGPLAVGLDSDFCNDNPWIAQNISCGGAFCGAGECGSGSCAGSNVQLSCRTIELHGGAVSTCACSSGPLALVVPGLLIPDLKPGSEIVATLLQQPSAALAEIPSLAADNKIPVPVVQEPIVCAADLNGDGVVDGADLGLLLSVWGPCR